MGLKSIEEDTSLSGDIAPDSFQKKPLYVWLRSFAGRELDEDDSFANFVSSSALTYALEYIGIASESEQSSLHLSAIFDEESHHQSRSNKYPSHFESETKSRIQQLNRIFVELISYYDYHHGQIVAIKPPNTVHISSSCHLCGVREFEKFLFLIMGAAIQGTHKQETIQKIKRFPQEIQESLINCIKLIADSPELINIKSWQEFHSLDEEEQKKTYENLLAVIIRLLIERNESIQNQLLSDYYAGFMNCSQKRIYENKGYGSYSDTEKYSDDTRMSAALRQLREELQIKSELLQECREELEITKYQVRELETELTETQIKLRAYKKARDELDVLREGQEKNSRLESELHRLKTKLEEAEHVYERVEVLEVENRKLQLQHDMLVDQISFYSLDRPSLDCSLEAVPDVAVDLDRTLRDDDIKFFESDEEEPSVKEKVPVINNPPVETGDDIAVQNTENVEQETTASIQDSCENYCSEDEVSEITPIAVPETSKIEDEPVSLSQELNSIENHSAFQSQLLEVVVDEDGMESGPPTSTPVSNKVEQKSQEVQTPPFPTNSKRKKRSSFLNVKKAKKPIFIPVLPGQRLVASGEVSEENLKALEEANSPAIKVFKIYNVRHSSRRRSSGKPKKFKTPSGRPLNDKQVVPNLDIGNEADEELSISPNGPRNDSDLESTIEVNGQTDKPVDNEEIFFSPDPGLALAEIAPILPESPPPPPSQVAPPSPNHYGTTTAFPIANGIRNTHTVHHVTFSPNDVPNNEEEDDEHHSNHLTTYNHNNNNNNIVKETATTVQLPLLRISNGINISLHHSDTEDEDDEVTKRLRSAFNLHLQHQQLQQQQQQEQEHNNIQIQPPNHHHQNIHIHHEIPSSSVPSTGLLNLNNNNNNDNEFNFSDCNIQVNLRNSSVKPATALINKISTLASSNSLTNNVSVSGRNPPPPLNTTQLQYFHTYQPHESSSEDDESVWYEYGCV